MRITVIEGYMNQFEGENNSVTLRINMGRDLSQYLNKDLKCADEIVVYISKYLEKYGKIFFSHHFRLEHVEKKYYLAMTRGEGYLYRKTGLYQVDGSICDLRSKLRESLDTCNKMLEGLAASGWFGTHYINIKFKNEGDIVRTTKDERHKMNKTKKHQSVYAFIDEGVDVTKEMRNVKTMNDEIKKSIDVVNDRYHKLMRRELKKLSKSKLIDLLLMNIILTPQEC